MGELAKIKPNFLDRAISFVNPKAGAERTAWRTLQASAYQAALYTRSTTPYGPSESMTGVMALTSDRLRNLRDRARYATQNNPIAAAVLSACVDNLIGGGFRHQAQSADAAWNKLADAKVADYLKTIDINGLSWLEHQRLVAKSLKRDGDIGILKTGSGKVQAIEGDYITDDGRNPESWNHDGILLDTKGRVSGYVIKTFIDGKKADYKVVSPKNLIFLKNQTRFTQYRGETSYATSLDLLDQIDRYLDAVIIAQQIAACLAIFIKKDNPSSAIQGLQTIQNQQGVQQKVQPLEPGMIQVLGQDESIQQVTPQQPGNTFDANVRMLMRLIGMPHGLPLEILMLDFSQTNNASARASLQQAQKRTKIDQNYIEDNYLTPLYCWIVDGLINLGELPDRPDAHKHIWHAEPFGYVDPVKEFTAMAIERDLGLTNLKQMCIERGIDYPSQIEENALVFNDMKRLGLPLLRSALTAELIAGNPNAQGNQANQTTPAQAQHIEQSIDGNGNGNGGDHAAT